MKSGAILVAVLTLCAAAAAQESADGAAAARSVVDSFHATLLRCMRQGEELGFEGRYELIAASLDETFDLPLMARAAVGATWKDLTPQQRADWVELSRRLSASRYADNFSSYAGQEFETISAEPAARGTILVKTQFLQPKDRDVQFDYRLRRVGEAWRVLDVQLDGAISELAMRRGQYRSVIDREGFPELVEALETQVEELSGE